MKNLEVQVPLVAFNAFCRSCGIAPITGWRFRKKGWIECVNIAGRPYVTSEEIERFKRRAADGEFAAEHKTPRRSPNAEPQGAYLRGQCNAQKMGSPRFLILNSTLARAVSDDDRSKDKLYYGQ